MLVDLDLLICRKKGITDGFTLGVIQGPIQRLIKADTRKLAVHHISDIALGNDVIIILELQLFTQADGQVSRFLLHEQLVGYNIRMHTLPCLRFSNGVGIELSSRMGYLFVDLDEGLLFRMACVPTKEKCDREREPGTTGTRTLDFAEGQPGGLLQTFVIVVHLEGCGQEKPSSLPIQEFGKKVGPAIFKTSKNINH